MQGREVSVWVCGGTRGRREKGWSGGWKTGGGKTKVTVVGERAREDLLRSFNQRL